MERTGDLAGGNGGAVGAPHPEPARGALRTASRPVN